MNVTCESVTIIPEGLKEVRDWLRGYDVLPPHCTANGFLRTSGRGGFKVVQTKTKHNLNRFKLFFQGAQHARTADGQPLARTYVSREHCVHSVVLCEKRTLIFVLAFSSHFAFASWVFQVISCPSCLFFTHFVSCFFSSHFASCLFSSHSASCLLQVILRPVFSKCHFASCLFQSHFFASWMFLIHFVSDLSLAPYI